MIFALIGMTLSGHRCYPPELEARCCADGTDNINGDNRMLRRTVTLSILAASGSMLAAHANAAATLPAAPVPFYVGSTVWQTVTGLNNASEQPTIVGIDTYNGGFTTVDVAGSRKTIVTSVNNSGTMLGEAQIGRLDYQTQAFVVSDGATTQIPLPQGAIGARPVGLNNNGTAIGTTFNSSGATELGWVYTAAGAFTMFPELGYSLMPTAINDNEVIVGNATPFTGLETLLFWTGTPGGGLSGGGRASAFAQIGVWFAAALYKQSYITGVTCHACA
jgi:hypothetical protein